MAFPISNLFLQQVKSGPFSGPSCELLMPRTFCCCTNRAKSVTCGNAQASNMHETYAVAGSGREKDRRPVFEESALAFDARIPKPATVADSFAQVHSGARDDGGIGRLQAAEDADSRVCAADRIGKRVVDALDDVRVVLELAGQKDRRADCGLEQRVGEPERLLRIAAVRDHMVHDRACAGRLAPDRDVRWVAAELGDVLLDPLESELLPERENESDLV